MLGNIVFIGPWEDLALYFIPSIKNNFPLQMGMLLRAIFLTGIASAIYIGVDTGAGPRDSLMLAFNRRYGWSLRWARGSIEVVALLFGWLLGGPIGVGTVVFALLIGVSVQWGFKLFNVQPNKPLWLSQVKMPDTGEI